MKRFIAVLTVFVMFVSMVGCTKLLGEEKNTPKARGYMAMRTYNAALADYKAWVNYTDLTADEVSTLTKKRDALITAYKPVNYYNTYVETGRIPTADMERELISWLDKIQRDALRNAARSRSVAAEKSDQQILKELTEAGLIDPAEQSQLKSSKMLSPSLIALLIELIRTGIHSAAVLFEMRSMSVEEIDAQWQATWDIYKAFDPTTLPVPQVGV
jgi:hypothetical protein